jgi:hypothetical protein
VGDILRAMALLMPYGCDADPAPTLEWLLRGQEPSGAFRTARGFASQISQREPGPTPEFRDLLPVCGWNDKAFRYLAEAMRVEGTGLRVEGGEWQAADGHTEPATRNPQPAPPSFEAECLCRGQRVQYREDESTMELLGKGGPIYRWRKGAPWAEVCGSDLLWK